MSTSAVVEEDWLVLESDPGLFTLLVEDFGVKGVQVEEIYDLQKPLEELVFGFIFLFKWNEEKKTRKKSSTDLTSPNLLNKSDLTKDDHSDAADVFRDLFFARQIVVNSCASHSLLSILLNTQDLELSPILLQLKEMCMNLSPEDRGLTIGRMAELAQAHNKHARPDTRREAATKTSNDTNRSVHATRIRNARSNLTSGTVDTFHFVSFIPFNGYLLELDGLKKEPINHGPLDHPWTKTFVSVIRDRIGLNSDSSCSGDSPKEIMYNLMAVVPDRRLILEKKIDTLKANLSIIQNTMDKLYHYSEKETIDDYKIEASPVVVKMEVDSNESVVTQSVSTCDVTKPLTIDTRAISTVPVDSPSEVTKLSPTDSIGSSAAAATSTQQQQPATRYSTRSSTKRDTLASNSLASNSIRPGSSPQTDSSSCTSIVGAPPVRSFTPAELLQLQKLVEDNIQQVRSQLTEEQEKHKKHERDDKRRTQDYDEFIRTFLTMLDKHNLLKDLIEQNRNQKKRPTSFLTALSRKRARRI